mmetsp:Transcript_248/g.518  ORF Transcript_248/g.518 Transcript_248/m.518 type:complete len:294 (-) Transcript_248:766-1647(-)
MSKFITCWMSGKSSPLAAMSVATSTSLTHSLYSRMASFLSAWSLPPWMDTASTPLSSRYSCMSSTSLFLSQNMITGGAVFCRHSSRYTIFASFFTYSTSWITSRFAAPALPTFTSKGLTSVFFCEVLELLRHGCGEEDGLPGPLELVDDVVHLFVEAQVQHSVSLVQAQVLADVHVQLLLRQVVVQSTRSGHDAVHAVPLCAVYEVIVGLSSNHQGASDLGAACLPQSVAEVLHIFVCLSGQLPTGAEDQSQGTLLPLQGHVELFFQGEHDHGQGEGQRLPGSRECNADDVSA